MHSLHIRRLDPDEDRDCFVRGWLWETEAAAWYKAADRVFGPPTFEDWLKASQEETRATFGVFEPELIAMFILTLKGKGLYEVDFLAKPKCAVGAIVEAGTYFRDAVFNDLGAQEVFCWTVKKNYSTRKLCGIIGFRDTGLRLLKGSYRGRVLEWHRLSITRPVIEAAQAA